MKKGFTLIELLAVILILGIIALIAIPTVNNIISEARYGAFKSGNDNIMKQVEQDCQTSIMKSENPTLSYLFTDGKSSNEINIKGKLPSDGYILLDRNCTITNYYLSDEKNIYSNEEDTRLDYMIKASTNSASIFKTMYPDYFDNIISVNFIDNLNIPENAIEIKDPSSSEKGKIKSWLIENEGFYDLYIGSSNKIYGNYNSSYFLSNLSKVIRIDFLNFDTSFIENMKSFLENDKVLETIVNANFNTSNVTNMHNLFHECNMLKEIDVSNWDTSNVTNMSGLFWYAKTLKTLNLTKWDTGKVTNMTRLFHICSSLESIDLSNFNTSNVTSMDTMFYGCIGLKQLDLSNFNTSNLKTAYGMFMHCEYLINLNLSNWDTKSLTKVYHYDGWTNFGMFDSCYSLQELNLSNWDISNIKSLRQLFNKCRALKKLDLSNWDFINVEEFLYTFDNCNMLENIKISNANNANIISQYLPDRTTSTTGKIIIINDKTGLDTSTLLSKNWNVV